MNKILKIFGVSSLLLIAYWGLTERDLVLTFVNSTYKDQIEMEYRIDDELSTKLLLNNSMLPNEFIQRNVSFGFHRLHVYSEDCHLNTSIRFFNLKRVEINLEFQGEEGEVCETLLRKSIFRLMYQ